MTTNSYGSFICGQVTVFTWIRSVFKKCAPPGYYLVGLCNRRFFKLFPMSAVWTDAWRAGRLHALQACLDSLPCHWGWAQRFFHKLSTFSCIYFCACDFYVGCKQRRWPRESSSHSSIRPSNDSCSHSGFLLTSLALCHPAQFFYEGKVRLGLTRGGWAESMKYIKVP